MNEVISRFGLSQRRVCRLTGWNRSSLQYLSEDSNDAALRERLRHWAALKPRWGLPILHDVREAGGMVINHKRTERLYREEGLSLRRELRRKLPAIARAGFDAGILRAVAGDKLAGGAGEASRKSRDWNYFRNPPR